MVWGKNCFWSVFWALKFPEDLAKMEKLGSEMIRQSPKAIQKLAHGP